MKVPLKNQINSHYSLVMANFGISIARNVFVFLLFAALISLFFTACASGPTVCQELDWYEIGRQDGAKGLVNNDRQPVRVVCEQSDESMAEALYNNGFDAGAAHYCTRTNGFELGRLSTPIQDICPLFSKEEFKTGYEQGRRYSELDSLRQQIDQRMQSLDSQLNAVNKNNPNPAFDIQTEKSQLRKQLGSLNKELESITP